MSRTLGIFGGRRRMRRGGRKSIVAVAVLALVAGLVIGDRMGFFGHWGKEATPATRNPTAAEDLATFDGKTFKVVHVVDGDTLAVEVPGEHEYAQKIRLIGVDTPETVKPHTPVQHFGPEASAFAKKVAMDQKVTLRLDAAHHTRDRYERLLAYVELPDGRELNKILVQEGYGYADPRFAHPQKADFEKLQKEAMKARRGLWKDVKESDLPEYLQGKIKLP